jgi:CRP/FNR family cyclic AMP-dependent transcriptional regulator
MIDIRGLHPSFASLSDASLDRLAVIGTERSYPSGSAIFEADGPADEFFVIRSGVVALRMSAPGREPLIVETLGPGELLGVSWAFPPYRWNWSAVAQRDVEAVGFDAATIRDAAHEYPELRAALLEAVASEAVGRLHATRMRLLDVFQAAS